VRLGIEPELYQNRCVVVQAQIARIAPFQCRKGQSGA
jgi:hypothetical protein